MTQTFSPRLLLIAAMLLTTALYWAGLKGPFVLDDFENFVGLQRWLAGQDTWQSVIFGQQSLLTARPLAMASFLLSASLGGMTPFAFKLGNLLVHLLCGALVWQFVRLAARQDTVLSERAEGIAVAVAALWLLHPFNASTVLYAVQRMTQLGTLFALAAVWTYLSARTALIAGQTRKAGWLLFALFPLLIIAGFFSKQHAVIAPALCLVLELAYFTGRPQTTGRGMLAGFFGLFLIAPAVLVLAALVLQPDRLLAGYADYEFTLTQRLLTQPRVLVDYLGQLLFPRGPRMGLYTDDVVASTGWLSPPSTLWALIALAGVSVLAASALKKIPGFFAGWFFFLAGHVIESSFLPLDLSFEHRNYLPAVGLIYALTSLGMTMFARFPRDRAVSRRLAGASCALLALVYATTTLNRALVWRHREAIIAEGVMHHPRSLMANLEAIALAQQHGWKQAHTEATDRMTASTDPQWRLLGHLYRIVGACARGETVEPGMLASASEARVTKITLTELHAFRAVALQVSAQNGCKGVSPSQAADTVVRVIDQTPSQATDQRAKWMSRFVAAQLYGQSKRWDLSEHQATLAWQPNADGGIGFFLAQVQAMEGRYESAQTTLVDVGRRTRCVDQRGLAILDAAWTAYERKQRNATSAASQQAPTWECLPW